MFNAKAIATEHITKMNPDMWDGTGGAPENFDPHIITYPVTDDTEMDISFELDDGEWTHYVEIRDKATESLLDCCHRYGINSIQNLADTIAELCNNNCRETIRSIRKEKRTDNNFWKTVSGTGMVFSYSEFKQMLKVYHQENPSQTTEVLYLLEGDDTDNIPFIRSKYAKDYHANCDEDLYEKAVTHIETVTPDIADGIIMVPFYRSDGRQNVGHNKRHPMLDSHEQVCYICWSRRNICDQTAFIDTPYADYDAFVQEFKDNFETYLPENFDWNAHLGLISYMVYG